MVDTMKPLWAAEPDLHPFSIGWRMGRGEAYGTAFWDWWDEIGSKMTEAERVSFIRTYPFRAAWSHVVMEMLWPERAAEIDEILFAEEGFKEERQALFDEFEAFGFPGEVYWKADLESEDGWQ